MVDEVRKPKPGLAVECNPTDVFDDLQGLRKQSALTVQRKKVITNISVDKPPNNVYFRTTTSQELVLSNATIVRDAEGTKKIAYFVTPGMRGHPKLAQRLRVVTLTTTCTWPGMGILLWPVPALTDRDFPPWRSARKAAALAQSHWMQMTWNEERGDYDVETAEGIDMDPIWPNVSLTAMLKIAFDGRVIDNEEHPYVKRLRGIID
jgi:hypothetical protein